MRLIITSLLLSFSSYGQINNSFQISDAKCKTDEVHEERMATDKQYKKITDDFNKKWAAGGFQNLQTKAAGPIYQVPVVVHILHTGEALGTGYNITDDAVKNGIQYLNNYWRKVAGTYGDGPGVDMEIEFSLAIRDESDNCTDGIVRRDMSGNSTYVNDGHFSSR